MIYLSFGLEVVDLSTSTNDNDDIISNDNDDISNFALDFELGGKNIIFHHRRSTQQQKMFKMYQ
jgi:hypothetical protein